MSRMPTTTTFSSTSSKKPRLDRQDHHRQRRRRPPEELIPGLPDHLAEECLSGHHPSLLYPVCRSWRRLIYSPTFPPFLSLYALLSPSSDHQRVLFSTFDPISSAWRPLPPPPSDEPLLLRHPSFIARDLPVQSVSASNRHLLLLAATTPHLLPALPRPLIFSPSSPRWRLGPPISPPRRWCAAGSLRGSVYLASGFASGYNQVVARSAARWTINNNENDDSSGEGERWEEVAAMRGAAFSREAVEAVGWRGKLCMVNVKGNAVKVGVVYDEGRGVWEEMREGMLRGWMGPVVAMDEEEMFVVDEGRGVMERYDEGRDCWELVVAEERLKGAVQMAAGGGRVCVVCGGGSGVVVVDVVARPGRVWVVEPPPGNTVIAVHVLPRISAQI